MPELPEVETVRKTLKNIIIGKTIKKVEVNWENIIATDLDSFKNNLVDQTFKDIKRRGKWLIFELDNYYLLSHLRMEGKYFFRSLNETLTKHDHVIFYFKDSYLAYNDTRKFGKMHLFKKEDVLLPLESLGYEPFDEIDAFKVKELLNKNKSIKTLLLDQSIIVGIGNIYANEILFLSKVSPHRMGKVLSLKEVKSILENTKKVLSDAIQMGGTTIKSFTSSHGVTGLFQQNLLVHQKDICPVCKEKLKVDKINTRTAYFCEHCQK